MYNSYDYRVGYVDGFKAGVEFVTKNQQQQQPQYKSVATQKWEAIIDQYHALERQKKEEYERALEEEEQQRHNNYWDDDEEEYRHRWDDVDDSSSDDSLYVAPRYRSMCNLLAKDEKIYRTFEQCDYKKAQDMIPHISESSQWSVVVTKDDFDTSDYEEVQTFDGTYLSYEWVLKDNWDQLKKENQNICIRTRPKRDMKAKKKIGTHEERKKTKKTLKEQKMAKKKTVRSSKKDNRRKIKQDDY